MVGPASFCGLDSAGKPKPASFEPYLLLPSKDLSERLPQIWRRSDYIRQQSDTAAVRSNGLPPSTKWKSSWESNGYLKCTIPTMERDRLTPVKALTTLPRLS